MLEKKNACGDFIKQALLWLARIIGASVFSFVAAVLPMYAVRMTSTSKALELAVDAVVGIISASLMLMYLSYRAYRDCREKPSLKMTVTVFTVAAAAYLAVVAMIGFAMPIAGFIGDLSNLFINGGETRLGLDEQTLGAGLAATLIFEAFYAVSVIVGYMLGVRKHEAEKAELMGKK